MANINGFSNYTSAGTQNYMMTITTSPYMPPIANDVCVGLCLQATPFQTSYVPGAATSEPFGFGGYSRAAAKSGDPSTDGVWSESDEIDIAETYNTANIDFPVSTETWGEIWYFGVFDNAAQGTGQLLWGSTLAVPKLIESETVVVFTANSLVIRTSNV